MGFYVQRYQGQRILKRSNNGFKVDQLAFTASKITTDMAFIWTGVLCIVFQQNVNLQGIVYAGLERTWSLRKQDIKNE